MKNILITGSAGFIGYNLVIKLLDKCSVTGIDDLSNSFTPEIINRNYKFIKCDIQS